MRWPGASGDDFREALDRLVARDARAATRSLADLAREVRFRYFDEPVIARRARARLRRDGRARRGAGRGSRARRPRASGSPRSSPARSRSRRCSPRACATPRRPLRRVLLEAMARRYYRVRTLEGFEPRRSPDGQPLLIARYRREGPRRHLAAAFVDLDDARAAPSRAFAQLGRDAARRRPGRARPLRRAPRRDAAARRARRARCAPRSPASRCPPACTASSSPSPQPERGPRHVGDRRRSPSGPAPRGSSRTRSLRGLHPMMAHRLRLWRLSELRARAAAVGRGRLPFRGVAHAQPEGRAAVRARRGARPHAGARRRRAGRRAARARAHARARRSRRSARFQARRTAEPAAAVEPHPAARLAGDRPHPGGDPRGHAAGWRRRRARPGHRDVLVQGRLREPDGSGARPRAALLHARRARASSSRSTIRRPSRCSRSTRARGGSSPRAGAASCTRPRSSSCWRRARRRRAGPAGRRVRRARPRRRRARSCRSTARRPPTTAGIVVGLIRNVTERYPEGMLRVILLGDPTRALGSLAEPECRRIIAALDLAEELGVPLEWFALSAGREDRDGQRHREHGLDRGGAAADHRVHPGGRRDQRRRHRHQRRRPAVLERRGDDAHAHARASSS